MKNKRTIQLLELNGAIVIINILLFSKAFLGWNLRNGTALSVSVSWSIVLFSVIVFIWGNNRILSYKEPPRPLAQKISSLSDCVPALKEAVKRGNTFDESILKNIEQIERFNRKSKTIVDVLLQKFSADEMSFQKFSGVLKQVENVICINVRSILNKIAAFDIDEYEAMQRTGSLSDELAAQKMDIYNEYISFVRNSTMTNENILLKLDKMLLEISRYNSIEDGDVQRLPAMMEMDELIKNAKLYK